jgi:hypothetical protein
MVLQDFLFPEEVVKYQSTNYLTYGDVGYSIYITNRRLIGHKQAGLLFKKDNVFSVALQEVLHLDYREEGRISKKGILHIQTKDQKYDVQGSPNDVKALWKEMQKFHSQAAARGASVEELSRKRRNEADFTDDHNDDDPSRILATRFAKGEITLEQYSAMKKALQQRL